MTVYMDLCCFNRPFDGQHSKTIIIETEAKLFIQEMIEQGRLKLLWSYMMDYENSANPDADVREAIAGWKNAASEVVAESENVLKKADELDKIGIGAKDAIHLACAIEGRAEYFITADKDILKRRPAPVGITIVGPTEFIQIMEEIK
ncbi:MAG: PIN domain-containing protein [Candidatus Edwardsbacteria bacterium]|nr:PIN domain-containing protein [Candidatus Edwardsbacteria bacterium]